MSSNKRFQQTFRGLCYDEILYGTPPPRGSDYHPTPSHLIGVGAEDAMEWYDDQVQALSWLRGISYSWIILGFSCYGSSDRLANTHLEVLKQPSTANPEDPAGELKRLIDAKEIILVKQDQICFNSCNGNRCRFGEDGRCKYVGCCPEGNVFWGKVPASGFPVSRDQFRLIKVGTFVDLYCEPCASDEESVEHAEESVEHDEESVEHDEESVHGEANDVEHDEESVHGEDNDVEHDEESIHVEDNDVEYDEESVEHVEANDVEHDEESVHGDHVVVTINADVEPDEEQADAGQDVTFGNFDIQEMAQLNDVKDQALNLMEDDEASLEHKVQQLADCLQQLDSLRQEIVSKQADYQQKIEEERVAEQKRIAEERAAEQQRIAEQRAAEQHTAEQQWIEEQRAAEQDGEGHVMEYRNVCHPMQVCTPFNPMYPPQMFVPDDHAILQVYTMSSGIVSCTECKEKCITITGHYYRTKGLWKCAVSVGPGSVIFNDAYNKPPRCWVCQNKYTLQQRQSECKVVPKIAEEPKPAEEKLSAAQLSALMDHMLSMAPKH